MSNDLAMTMGELEAESAELLFPVVYEAFELRGDSAGAGLHRGGQIGAQCFERVLRRGACRPEGAFLARTDGGRLVLVQ